MSNCDYDPTNPLCHVCQAAPKRTPEETPATSQQLAPESVGIDIPDLVCEEIQERADFGASKYGERLKTYTGRDAMIDAYQEIIDLLMYWRQEMKRRQNARYPLTRFLQMLFDYAGTVRNDTVCDALAGLLIELGKELADLDLLEKDYGERLQAAYEHVFEEA